MNIFPVGQRVINHLHAHVRRTRVLVAAILLAPLALVGADAAGTSVSASVSGPARVLDTPEATDGRGVLGHDLIIWRGIAVQLVKDASGCSVRFRSHGETTGTTVIGPRDCAELPVGQGGSNFRSATAMAFDGANVYVVGEGRALKGWSVFSGSETLSTMLPEGLAPHERELAIDDDHLWSLTSDASLFVLDTRSGAALTYPLPSPLRARRVHVSRHDYTMPWSEQPPDDVLYFDAADGLYRLPKRCAVSQLQPAQDAACAPVRLASGATRSQLAGKWLLYATSDTELKVHNLLTGAITTIAGFSYLGPFDASRSVGMAWDGGKLRRFALPSGSLETIYQNTEPGPNPLLKIDGDWVFYAEGNGFPEGFVSYDWYSLPLTASRTKYDIAVEGIEITQAIQNSKNDVLLVAERPAWARVFVSDRGTPAAPHFNDLRVEVLRSGQWLGFLQPYASADLATGPVDPATDYWLYKIPSSMTGAGDLTVRAMADPAHRIEDVRPANNNLEATARFVDSRNVCLVVFRVDARGAPLMGQDTVPFNSAIRYARNIVPARRIDWYPESAVIAHTTTAYSTLRVCIPFTSICQSIDLPTGMKEVSFDLSTENHREDVLNVLGSHRFWSISPTICEHNSRQPNHEVFMGIIDGNAPSPVSPDRPNTRVAGLARRPSNVMWATFTEKYGDAAMGDLADPSDTTTPHELLHTMNQKHVFSPLVPGCSQIIANTETYPYSDGRLDHNDGLGAHYGFISNRLGYGPYAVSPLEAFEIQTYCTATLKTSSSHRWSRTMDWLRGNVPARYALQLDAADTSTSGGNASGTKGGRPNVDPAPQAPADAATFSGVRAGSAVLVATGVVTPSARQGKIVQLWSLPAGALEDAWYAKWRPFEAKAPAPGDAQQDQLQVRLTDAQGRELSTGSFALEPLDADGAGSARSFTAVMPVPAGCCLTVDLLYDGQWMNARGQSATAPAVQILRPRAGEIVASTAPLTVEWTATDVERNPLTYVVQYSNDLGETWHALRIGLPDTTSGTTQRVTLTDTSLLPAGTGTTSLVRVIANDGFHSTTAMSAPFRVQSHPPRVYITSPGAAQAFEAGSPIAFQGEVLDIDRPGSEGWQLDWTLDGVRVDLAPVADSTEHGTDWSLLGVAPGDHDVDVVASASGVPPATGGSSAESTFSVRPLVIRPTTGEVVLDGKCMDAGLAEVPQLPLTDDGVSGLSGRDVRVAVVGDRLWACFSGLTDSPNRVDAAIVFVDPDHSRDDRVQPDDLQFGVTDTGLLSVTASGATVEGRTFDAYVYRVAGEVWDAELAIPLRDLGGAGRRLGILFAHRAEGDGQTLFGPNAAMHVWPRWPNPGNGEIPRQWATAWLGDPARLLVAPQHVDVAPNATTTLDLRVEDVGGLYGAELELAFDADTVQVVDASTSRPGVQIEAGDFLRPRTPELVSINEADNVAGTIKFTVTLDQSQQGRSGSGVLAKVTFRGTGPGRTSSVRFTVAKLSDAASQPIAIEDRAGEVSVQDDPSVRPFALEGTVQLERRRSNAGASVCSGGACTTTDAAGKWSLDGVRAGQQLSVVHPSYLASSRQVPARPASGDAHLQDVTLLGGDVGGRGTTLQDGQIDVWDAYQLTPGWGAHRGEARWLAQNDITADGTVDVFDLVAVRFNIDKSAPGPWPGLLTAASATRSSACPAATAPCPSAATHVPNGTASTAQATASVRLALSARTASVGQQVTVDVQLADAVNVWGYDFALRYDPETLEVVDADPSTPDSIEISGGSLLGERNLQLLFNHVDVDTGRVRYGQSLVPPGAGRNGTGTMATITFRVIAEGSTALRMDELNVVDDTFPSPRPIPVRFEETVLDIDGAPRPILLPALLRNATFGLEASGTGPAPALHRRRHAAALDTRDPGRR